jgi:hypothetical protein
MATPNKKDYDSWQKILKQKKVGLLEDGSPKRKMDEHSAKAFFRSAVRKRWMHCNAKLYFLESQRIPDEDPTSRRKWKYRCSICKQFFSKEHVDVDHIEGEKSFTEWDQAFTYASSILDVGTNDLQLLCNADSGTNCHATKSTCERLGLDWTDAKQWGVGKFEQKFNRIMDGECKKAQGQKDWIATRGLVPDKNEELRKNQIRELLTKEEINHV